MILAAVLAVTLIAQTPSPGSATIQGQICEVRTCVPISGARVLLSLVGQTERSRAAVTDRAGLFRFAQLAAGEYRINVAADNFQLSSILSIVTVSDGAT